jgi:large subunit ribosomal protein L21
VILWFFSAWGNGAERNEERSVYAIVQNGGHQVKMVPGATVMVDRVEAAPGSEVSFDQVLLVEKDGGEVLAGAPFVANARVVAVVAGEARGPKIRIFKKKRRKGMRRNRGFRADLTSLVVRDIIV